MWPAILGMTYAALPEAKAGLAGGLILGAAGIGNAMGPLLGGVLTDELGWRWIFFLNVPIAAFAVLVTWLKVHQPRPGGRGPADRLSRDRDASRPGSCCFLLAFDQAADWGFGDPAGDRDARRGGLLRRRLHLHRAADEESALIPADVFATTSSAPCASAVLLMSAVFFATVLYGPQFMEKILGYSALKAGVGMVPMLGMLRDRRVHRRARFIRRLGPSRRSRWAPLASPSGRSCSRWSTPARATAR